MNISKKYIWLLWIGLLATCLMTACKPESREGVPDGDEARVSVQFSLQGNEVVLRATEAGTVAEDLIDHVDLYIFNKSTGALVSHQTFDKAAIKEVNTSTFDVKAGVNQGVEYTFVALANMPNGTAPASPASIDVLRKVPVNGLPASPFVMFGEVTTTVLSDNDIVHVPMARNCVAIDIANSDPTFTLEEGFWIYNLEQNGYVDADPSTVAGFTSSLSGETQLTGTADTPARAYTHPRNVTVGTDNPATFIIFKGKMANGQTAYYRTDVNVVDGQQVFEKNHIYRVMITKVTDLGYATLEEAKAATADKKVVYTVSDWDNKNESSVTFFGNYFLKLEKRSFIFDYAQQSESVEVLTNAPGIAITPPGGMATDVDGNKIFTNSVAGWCAVKEAFLDEANGTRRYLLNVGVFENLEKEEVRSAGFYVSAIGIHTDDLKVLGEVNQMNVNYYLPYTPNFKLTPEIFYDSSQDESEYVATITLPLSRQEWIVEEYTDDVDNPIIASIADKNGVITTFSQPYGNGRRYNESTVRSIGDGQITIRTNKLADGVERKPRVARLIIGSGLGYKRFGAPIIIFQDFNLKYNITYPASVSDQMKRSKYVIETPLFEKNPLTYDIAVTSNTSWRAEIYPKEAESWVSFDPTTPANHQHAAGNYLDETTSFKVIVKPNDAQPLEGGYPPARQAVVSVICYQEEEVFRTANIVVYQGGYVKIGEDIWLDRNLKSGYYYSYEYWKTGNDTDGYDYYFPMLYPYANPVGLPTDYYGAYARNNTTLPRINTYDYGDDGYFVSGAPQSGYGPYYYRPAAYGGGKSYQILDVTTYDWLPSYTTYNPCPPGWQVPWLSQWDPIINLVNSGYYYGKPLDVSLNPLISAQNGEMVVHNSGRYITVGAMPNTNGGPIDWYLPAAGNRVVNAVNIVFPGVFGSYKVADKYYNRDQIRHFYFSHNNAFIYPDNVGSASSVRCVKVR